MNARKWVLSLLIALFGLAGCATIAPPQMTYLGEATQKNEVVGKSTHWDIAGLGVGAKQYADEYNAAIDDAFQNAPAGTQVLKNMKVFRSPNNGPLLAGVGTMLVGAAFVQQGGYFSQPANIVGGNPVGFGMFLFLTGLGVATVNTYDFVVVAEPSSN